MAIPTPYEDVLADLLEKGTPRADRTGAVTIGAFGHQIRFDLAKGFPLITTMKVSYSGRSLGANRINRSDDATRGPWPIGGPVSPCRET